MSAPVPPHVPARAVLVEVAGHGHERRHWEIEWQGAMGVGRSGSWYGPIQARQMAEACGATDIVELPLP